MTVILLGEREREAFVEYWWSSAQSCLLASLTCPGPPLFSSAMPPNAPYILSEMGFPNSQWEWEAAAFEGLRVEAGVWKSNEGKRGNLHASWAVCLLMLSWEKTQVGGGDLAEKLKVLQMWKNFCKENYKCVVKYQTGEKGKSQFFCDEAENKIKYKKQNMDHTFYPRTCNNYRGRRGDGGGERVGSWSERMKIR